MMMNGPETPKHDQVEDKEVKLESLFAKLPLELRSLWEHRLENKSIEESIATLEEVIGKRKKLLDTKMEKVRYLIDEIKRSGGEEKFFLGKGSVARVYRTPYSEDVGVKILVNEEQRKKHGNTFSEEGKYMEEMEDFEVDGIRTPHVYYFDKNEGVYIGMEIIDGKSLRDIKANKEASHDLVQLILSQDKNDVIRRLQHFIKAMHAQKGILHRDLDDGNIMIDKHGHWYIIDFGRAKKIDVGEDATHLEDVDIQWMREAILDIYRALEGERDLTNT